MIDKPGPGVGLRIGFVGCGLIAHHHATNLVADGRAAIVAVHDLDTDRARQFARRFSPDRDGAVVADPAAVIDAVDAVYVCTWTSAHQEPVMAAARAGRAVFCEKPLATDLAGATAMTGSWWALVQVQT